VNNKNEYLIDKYGRRGHLTNVGNVYAFQPTEITDERASIFERSVPVDYKPTALQLELRMKNTEAPPTVAQTVTEIDAIKGIRAYADVLQGITDNMKSAIIMNVLETGEVDWYKHLGNATFKLKQFHSFLTDDLITKYAIHHSIDAMPLGDKLLVLQYLYNGENTTLLDVERKIKAYLDTKIMRAGSRTSILFMIDENEKPSFKIFVQDAVDLGVWTELPSTDYGPFKPALSKHVVNVNNYNDIIGFMSSFKNNKIVFKTKKLTDKRNNKGAYCENAGKNDIVMRLNEIAGSPIYSDTKINQDIVVEGIKQSNIIFKNGLCVMMEILLRYYDEKKHRGSRWFFNPEEAVMNRIADSKK
jgi:hypothetical protein